VEEIKRPYWYTEQPEKKSERSEFLLRPSTKEALKEIAKAQDTTVNDLVNVILQEYIIKVRG